MMEGGFSHELMPPRKRGVKSRGQGGRCAEKATDASDYRGIKLPYSL